MNDGIKSELITKNFNDPEKLNLIEKISRPGYQVLEEMKSPRFIKTHFPFSLLPPNLLDVGCKVNQCYIISEVNLKIILYYLYFML